jgi:hypothetical protein
LALMPTILALGLDSMILQSWELCVTHAAFPEASLFSIALKPGVQLFILIFENVALVNVASVNVFVELLKSVDQLNIVVVVFAKVLVVELNVAVTPLRVGEVSVGETNVTGRPNVTAPLNHTVLTKLVAELNRVNPVISLRVDAFIVLVAVVVITFPNPLPLRVFGDIFALRRFTPLRLLVLLNVLIPVRLLVPIRLLRPFRLDEESMIKFVLCVTPNTSSL